MWLTLKCVPKWSSKLQFKDNEGMGNTVDPSNIYIYLP